MGAGRGAQFSLMVKSPAPLLPPTALDHRHAREDRSVMVVHRRFRKKLWRIVAVTAVGTFAALVAVTRLIS